VIGIIVIDIIVIDIAGPIGPAIAFSAADHLIRSRMLT
jgi:hypothetical protein